MATRVFSAPGATARRLAGIAAAMLLVSTSATMVLANAGNPTGTITESVPDHANAPLTVSLSGTWLWPEFTSACGPGSGPNRAAGWAVDWGDGFTGNRSLRKGSSPAAYVHLGTAADNTVHRSTVNSGLGDCGSPSSHGAIGSWGPITHTYAAPGTYTACVSIYDVHYMNDMRTKLDMAIDGQATFGVDKGSTIAIGDVLLIDKEQMLVTARTGNTITVTRGVNGTTVASHKKNANVSAIVPADSKQLIAGSNAAKYATSDHNADNSVETNSATSGQPQCLPVTFRVYGPSRINVLKTADVTQASVGDTVTYTFTVTNTGDSPLDVELIDAKCDLGTLSQPTGDTNQDLKLDKTETWTYTCTHKVVDGESDPLHNVVRVTGVDIFGTSVSDTDALDVGIVTKTDVSVTKVDDVGGSSVTPSAGAVVAGTSFTYTIVVHNGGGSTATSVAVSDPLPTGITSFVWSGNGQANVSGAISDTIASLAPGGSVTYTVTATVDPSATGTLSNTVTATAAGDVNTANDSATDTDTISQVTDVSVTKTDGVTSVVAGHSTTYTITVGNGGLSTATDVAVSDPLPTGITSFVWSGNGQANVSGAISDTISSLAPGASVTYTVVATVDPSATGGVTNTVSVSAGGDHNAANDTASDTDTVDQPGVDVSVTKVDDVGGSSVTPSTGAVVAGTSFTYTIVVHNGGGSTATSVAVSDPLPTGITSFVWSGNGQANVSGAISDTIASLAPGGSVTYTVTATVDPSATGTLSNTVTATAAGDVNTANDSATDTDTISQVTDVSVTKTDGVTSVVAGHSTTYTITVGNGGLSTATDVAVSDPLPTGITSFVWSGNGQANVSGAISDTISSLAPGASVTYTVVATVDPSATGGVTNTVSVSAGGDHNAANDTASDTDTISQQNDVSVTKTDGRASVVAGHSTTYTITVGNSGPSTATSVAVSDLIPVGLTSLTWSGNGHMNTSGAISDTIASLAPGASITYTVVATVDPSATGSLINTVSVTASNDANDANNTATDTDTISPVSPADDDTYTGAIGNTKLAVGVTDADGPVVFQYGSVLDNDTGTGTLTAELLTPNPAGGRVVTMNTDGTFIYVPAPGFTGTDTFEYTLKNDGTPTGTGTVSVTVSNMVWYVDNAAPAGDGRSTSPFNSLAPLTGAGDPDGSGDIIFVYSGSGNYGPITLEANQELIGQPTGLIVASHPLVPDGGSNPILVNGSGNCITLASGNTIDGISTGNCSGTGIAGTSVGTLAIGSSAAVNVVNGTGKAIDIDTGVMDVTLTEASSTGSATNGIRLANATGTFNVNAGTIQTAAGDGVSLSNVTNVHLSGMTIDANLGSGINGTGVTGFAISGSTVTDNGDDATADEAGIRFDGLLGTASISTTTVSGSVKDNVRIVNSSGVLTSLALNTDTIEDNSVTSGNDGLTIEANGNATMTVTVNGGTFSGNRARGIKATTSSSGALTLTVTNGTYVSNLIHVDITDNSTGGLAFNVHDNDLSTTGLADGTAINVFLGTGGTGSDMVGTISNNTIDNNDSLTAPGITALATGSGHMVIAVADNTITKVANIGISAIASQGSSALDATITGNAISLTSTNAVNDILVASGSSLVTDTNAVCAAISGNTVSTASSFGDTALRVRNRQAATTFRLPTYGGLPTDDSAVAAFVSGVNSGATASATHSASAGFAGGAACQTPP